MYPTSPVTTTTGATTTTTTSAATVVTTTTMTTTAAVPAVRIAAARTSLLDLPNEVFFQIAVHLAKSGYPVFFPALANLALVSRRTAELMAEIASRIHRMHKPCTVDSVWLWTKLQNGVDKQVRGGQDARLAVSAGLNRLLKPGMHLVPRAGKMLDAILSAKHAELPCSTITFDIPRIVSEAMLAQLSIFSDDPIFQDLQMQEMQPDLEEALCQRIEQFLLQNAQLDERPEVVLTWTWGREASQRALRALVHAAVKYEKAFLKLESKSVLKPEIDALCEALKSGKVISIDLNVRSMDDAESRKLMQAVREADSLRHIRIHCNASRDCDDNPDWACLLPELNGHESLRKLTVLHWGPAETTRRHLENLPDCPNLKTVEFRICVNIDGKVGEESRKMRELVDTLRRTDEDKFSVTFVVGASYPGDVEI